MRLDVRQFGDDHPLLIRMIVLVKTARTKVGLALVVACLAEGVYSGERPFDLDEPNVWVVVGIGLIVTGLAMRIAALGELTKKCALATKGVYSLCRHPLYLGSILLTYGFCVCLNDLSNFIVATAYFGIFYTLVIVWEEVRLREQYGEAHRRYCEEIPLLLPLGGFRRGAFSFVRAMRSGGWLAIAMTAVLVAGIEVMGEVLQRR